MLLAIMQRVAFYGLALWLLIFAIEKIDAGLSGGQLWMIFAALATLGVAIHTANLAFLPKLTDLEKNAKVGYWANKRLLVRTENRRQAVTARAYLGLVLAVLTGVLAAYMRANEQLLLPATILGLSVFSAFFSVLMGILTVSEGASISRLESKLHSQLRVEKDKIEARKLLAGDRDKDTDKE